MENFDTPSSLILTTCAGANESATSISVDKYVPLPNKSRLFKQLTSPC